MVGTLYDRTERKRIEQRLERSQQQLRSLAAHLQSVRERERAAVAREIHDEMGQALTAIKMDLFRLKERIKTDETLRALTERVLASVDTTIAAVQRVMSELHPPVLDDLGLASAVEWQLEQFQQRTGIESRCVCDVQPSDLCRECSLALFRILQESLTNVTRHSRATEVGVRLQRDADWIELEVGDNGRGIAPSDIESESAFGLMGMRERAHVFGGELDISGVPSGGTRLLVRMPLSGDSGERERAENTADGNGLESFRP